MEGTVASVPPQGGRKHPQQEFLQVDTTNILFIYGGAFAGLDKLISSRNNEAGISFRQMYVIRRQSLSQIWLIWNGRFDQIWLDSGIYRSSACDRYP